ncbi:MAG: SMP-30/gluconolactonase/LRE family protein [Chloroflexi bacterium]|nr:SMP-30/gluconolactonase/LRE family protein [Chloroflexota bacterium]MCA2000251.1 SMP-30/gluconolactonase/LRE family protein [Chloroflexota bacterium]
MKAELLFDAQAALGEGPAWDAKSQTLYWVDILEKRIYAGSRVVAQLERFIGCLAPRRGGGLIAALSDGAGSSFFVDLQPDTARQSVLAAVHEPAANRFNDGKCDPAGRFLAGTMAMNESDPTGALYSFDGKRVVKLFGGATISNGLTWSPDYKTFYYIDTPTRKVQAFDYDLATGQVANPRAAIQIPASLGWADGMTSDAEGNLWIAMWGGAQVTRWNPQTGRLLEQIPVPALQTSSCAFGGKDMNELYVTSARKGMSASDLKKYPLSGGLFKVETKVAGLPAFEFAQTVPQAS